MSWIVSLFCRHKWVSHSKEVYSWSETRIIEGTEIWFNPLTETRKFVSTTEVLICSECGKIKKIEY